MFSCDVTCFVVTIIVTAIVKCCSGSVTLILVLTFKVSIFGRLLISHQISCRFYQEKGILRSIDAMQSPEKVFEDISGHFKK